jgi:hypothetical protein
MPTFANNEALSSVRQKINTAIEDVEWGRGGFATPDDLFNNVTLTNDNTLEGQIFTAGGFRYQRAASTATDHHRTTAGGVKLYVLTLVGAYWADAFGAVADDATDSYAAIQAACDAASAAADIETRVMLGAGIYRTSQKISVKSSFRGMGVQATFIKATTGDFTPVEVQDGVDFLSVGDFRIVHAVGGTSTGSGIRFVRNNNNLEVLPIEVQRFAIGFDFNALNFLQIGQQLRAVQCTTGFFCDGRDTDNTAAGTTLILNMPYAVDCVTGFDLQFMDEVTLNMPTTDFNGNAQTFITTTGVNVLNIENMHFEANSPPVGNGQAINFNTSGVAGSCLNIIGGNVSALDSSALTYRLIRIGANDDEVRVNIIGLGHKLIDVGSNHIIEVDGDGSSNVEVNFIGSRWPTKTADVSGMTGAYQFKDYTAAGVKPQYSGVAAIQSGGNIATGIPRTPFGLVSLYDTDDTSVPVLLPIIVDQFTNGDIKVRFYSLATGAESTGITYNVAWTAW